MARKAAGGTSKVDMVRDAIAKLGWDASTAELGEYIKSTYNAEMSTAHISQTKSNEKKRQGIKRRRRKGGRKAAAESAPVASSGSASITDILAFVGEVQRWEEKLGASMIRDVVKNVLKK